MGPVGNDAGEHIDTAGGAFRIGRGGDFGRQSQAFHQFGDIDAARFQHGALGQVDFMQGQGLDARADGPLRPRQEAGPHAPRPAAQAQIQARRLDLAGREGGSDADRARAMQGLDLVGRQNAAVLAHRTGVTDGLVDAKSNKGLRGRVRTR